MVEIQTPRSTSSLMTLDLCFSYDLSQRNVFVTRSQFPDFIRVSVPLSFFQGVRVREGKLEDGHKVDLSEGICGLQFFGLLHEIC